MSIVFFGSPEAWVDGLGSNDREFMISLEPSDEGQINLAPPTGLGPPITFPPGFKLRKKTWVVAYYVEVTLEKGAFSWYVV